MKLDLPEFCIPYSSGNLLWKYRLQQPLQSTYFDDNGDLITSTLTEFEPFDFWKEDELYLDEGEDCLVYNLSVFVCEKRGPKKSLSELLSPIIFLLLPFAPRNELERRKKSILAGQYTICLKSKNLPNYNVLIDNFDNYST